MPERRRHDGWNGTDHDRHDVARDAEPRRGHDAGPGHPGALHGARDDAYGGTAGGAGKVGEAGDVREDAAEGAPDSGLLPAPGRPPAPAAVDSVAAVAPDVIRRPAAVLLAVTAALLAIAAVLPWSELSSGDETRTLTGFAVGDGRLTAVLAVVLGWVGCAAAIGRRAFDADVVVARLAAAGVVAVTAFDVAFGPPTLSSVRGISGGQITVTPEVGAVLSLAAGLVAGYAAVLLRRR